MNETDFIKWLKEKRNRRDNTIKMYKRYLKELPDIDLINMSEEEIRGAINSTLSKFPNQVAKSAYVNYIEFLFSNIKPEPYIFYEKMRVKKNSIIANIEIPKEARQYHLDLEKFYISKNKLLFSIKKVPRKTKYIIILLYDGALRINELLKNDWSNIDERGIFVPSRISKTGRDRYIEWLMPESSKLISKIKKRKGLVEKTLQNSHATWKQLQKLKDMKYTPHSLRHTRLTDLAAEGWELGRLQRRAGHSDPKITQYYISWAANRKEEIMTLETYCQQNSIDLMSYLT